MKKEKYDEVKQLTETAIKRQTYGEVPQDPRVFLYCGVSNLKLGYYILAEQMLKKAILFPEIQNEAKEKLALLYQSQGLLDQVCQLYKEIIQEEPSKHHISFALAKTLSS